MRRLTMRSLPMLALPLLIASPAAAQRVDGPTVPKTFDRCAPTADKTVAPKVGTMGKLGDQPPAAQVLSVYHRGTDGCPAPIVLRKGIGANPEKALPMARGQALKPIR